MPDRQPESQEEILAACEASLTEADIPPEDEAFGWPDPDCDMPAELLALSDAELDELLEAAPAQPTPLAWPLSYRTPGCPVSPPDPAGHLPPRSGSGATQRPPGGMPTSEDEGRIQSGAGVAAEASLGGFAPRENLDFEDRFTSGNVPDDENKSESQSAETGVPGALLGGCVPGDVAGPEAGFAQGGFAQGGFAQGGVAGLEAGFAQGGVLDELPAGMVLAGFAEDGFVRVGELGDDAQVGVLRAWRRLTSWAQARELAMVTELARRRPAPGTPPAAVPGQLPAQLSEFVADEVGLALTLTGTAAQAETDLALDLASRPAIAAALETGRIDLPRARILLSVICPLEPAHADAVESAVLPRAGDLTTGQLRAALQRAVLAVDPDAARRRREEAQKGARVEHWADPEGTATLAGRYLPPAEVLAADKRLCAIATAWKKLGGQGGMDLLRAHVYLALLLGQPIDTPPPGLLLPRAGAPAPASHGPGPDGNGSLCPLTTPGPSQHGAGTPGHGDGPAPAGLRRPGASTGGLPPMTGTVNLTVPLTTLLGLADQPGEAAGHGPLHADTIRTLTHAMTGHPGTRWGVIITSATGRAMGYGGSVPARPTSAGGWKITITTEPIAPYP